MEIKPAHILTNPLFDDRTESKLIFDWLIEKVLKMDTWHSLYHILNENFGIYELLKCSPATLADRLTIVQYLFMQRDSSLNTRYNTPPDMCSLPRLLDLYISNNSTA